MFAIVHEKDHLKFIENVQVHEEDVHVNTKHHVIIFVKEIEHHQDEVKHKEIHGIQDAQSCYHDDRHFNKHDRQRASPPKTVQQQKQPSEREQIDEEQNDNKAEPHNNNNNNSSSKPQVQHSITNTVNSPYWVDDEDASEFSAPLPLDQWDRTSNIYNGQSLDAADQATNHNNNGTNNTADKPSSKTKQLVLYNDVGNNDPEFLIKRSIVNALPTGIGRRVIEISLQYPLPRHKKMPKMGSFDALRTIDTTSQQWGKE